MIFLTQCTLFFNSFYREILMLVLLFLGIGLNLNLNKKIKEKEHKINDILNRDSLTGLYNRQFAEEQFKNIDKTGELPVSIILGDLNGLKIINDAFGHATGDNLLIHVAKVLKTSCREKDILSRYGGDEFLVLLYGTSKEVVAKICDRIKEKISIMHVNDIPLSMALGYATKATPEKKFQDIFKEADEMMYEHKLLESKSKKNSIVKFLEKFLYTKDIETEEHSLRLIETTLKVGYALDLSPIEMVDLELSARLHDIGKIAIDEKILKKPEKLTKEEFDEIKQHSEAGYRILMSTENLNNIACYILHHHEKWDGSGYPKGLMGNSIPLFSRIIAIADAYDAMTHDRPYRRGLTKTEAITELQDKSGSQFDPHLVSIFIAVLT